MMRVSRFSSDYPNFEFFLLRIHLVNELEGPIDDSEKKSNWAPPYSHTFCFLNDALEYLDGDERQPPIIGCFR